MTASASSAASAGLAAIRALASASSPALAQIPARLDQNRAVFGARGFDRCGPTEQAGAMTPDGDRERLRETFNQAAGLYQRARPDYPDELFDDLLTVTGLARGDRLLEIGCATGKATLPLARRGFKITCIEPGPQLAAAARRNLDGLDAEITGGRFEDWRPRHGEQFGLVFAATAWNWVDPALRYALAWRALRPGLHLAFWNAAHVIPDDGDSFFRDIQDVYDEIGEALPPGTAWPRPGELEERTAEIQAGLLRGSHVIVDDVALAVAMGALGNAGLSSANAAGTLAQVLQGRVPGRRDTDEITIYAPVGLPWQDLALTWVAYRCAVDSGTGVEFDFLS